MFEYWLDVDKTNLPPVKRLGDVFSQDSGANKIGVRVTENRLPVTLTGSVKAWIVKPNGSTIEVDGEKDGNKAWVVLPEGAYTDVGLIGIFVKLINGTQVTTLGGVEAYVYKSR